MKYVLVLISLVILWSCNSNNVIEDNSLKSIFDQNGTQGTFALLDNGSNKFTVYNLKRYRDSAFTPASTFKIVNGLIGLQTGVVENDSMVIKWDGLQRPAADWNRDLNFYNAFRVSAVPYFQEVARRIGRDTMQRWLDTLAYGSKKIKSRIDTFWLDGSLTIRPDEQMGLVKRLYFNQLPFHKVNQESVKRAMLMEDQPAYKLSYKTGMTQDPKTGRQMGWIVGYIEENRHPFFFVLNLDAPAQVDLQKARMAVLKSCLDKLGFMKGKK
ncbi:penicillin-binding transpeptidase domain-containing protein [Cnuella takakiae]|nr:penicillin-binding transpeptidase domain-containing protein [Cnuella takakiae]OLY94981.1 class D beta-lactamase [Cnuella takakiae]